MEKPERSQVYYNGDLLKANYNKFRGHTQNPFLPAEDFKNIDKRREPNLILDQMVAFIEKNKYIAEKNEEKLRKARRLIENNEEKEEKSKEAAEMKISAVLNRQVSSVLQRYKYFYKRNCPVKIPYKSTASKEEHIAYLRAFIKFQIRPPKTASEEAEYQNYLTLQGKFLEEQTCMMTFSFEVMKLQLNEINQTPIAIDQYIAAYVQERSKRIVKYQENFTQEIEIPIKPQDHKGLLANLTLDYIGNVLSIGTLGHYYLPNPHLKTVLAKKLKWQKKPPTYDKKIDENKYIYKTTVSEDPNAEYLAKKHDVSIVMSASAFKVLVNNLDSFDKEWTIPVRIKTHIVKDSSGNDVSRRVAYFDKPLVRKMWCPMQKKKTFYKMAALEQFTQYKDEQFYKFMGNEADEKPYDICEEIDESFGSSFDAPELDEDSSHNLVRKRLRNRQFNKSNYTTVPPPDYTIKNKHLKSEYTSDSSDNIQNKEIISESIIPLYENVSNKRINYENKTVSNCMIENKRIKSESQEKCGFLDDIMSSQSTMLNQETSRPIPKPYHVTSNIGSYIKNCGSSQTNGTPWSHVLSSNNNDFKVKECPSNSMINKHYQLFTLNHPDKNNSLTILIRHNIHGITRYKANMGYRSESIVTYPKIENQAYFGSEVNSFHNVVEQWASLVTKPNSVLFQVHICTETGTVIMGTKKRLTDILREGKQKHINFQPEAALASLYVALQTTLIMPTGEYILFHSGKTEAFIKLMKASRDDQSTTSRPTLNIHAAYEKGEMLSRIYNSPPWLAIDTHVLTPFHLSHLKVPATFPMANDQKLSKQRKNFIKSRAKKKKTMNIGFSNTQ